MTKVVTGGKMVKYYNDTYCSLANSWLSLVASDLNKKIKQIQRIYVSEFAFNIQTNSIWRW